MHLAPLAVHSRSSRTCHIIVGNGLLQEDVAWLRTQVRGVPVVSLRASLKNNAKTYLPHAEVIRLCEKASNFDFCIQDADCFITDAAWWDALRLQSSKEYAAGPFYKPIQKLEAWMPDTYLVLLNKAAYRKREADGIRPDISPHANMLAKLLETRGIGQPYFPEAGKTYFDTLHIHWLAAALRGEEFRKVPGADQTVFHVGGSTYLTGKDCEDVSHWDYWPLNTPYFHMRVLEFPRFASIKPRFSNLFQRYGSPTKLLATYPEFKKSQRFLQTETVLAFFEGFLKTN